MEEKYMPRVGDKVRATLGENVLVGQVAEIDPVGPFLKIEPSARSIAFAWHEGWLFEEIVSVPSKFGAVIRRADGKKFSRYKDDCWTRKDGGIYLDRDVTKGGFTVLFEGVDE